MHKILDQELEGSFDGPHPNPYGPTCSICNGGIRTGETYYTATMTAQNAPTFPKTNRPGVVQNWRQVPGGNVELTICGTCVRKFKDTSMMTGCIL